MSGDYSRLKKYQNGMSLVEVMLVVGVMGIVTLGVMTMLDHQQKSNNFLDYQLQKMQLQSTLVGQILNNPDNCACLFSGANAFPIDPAAPGAELAGAAPFQLGQFKFIVPGDCATATVPQPLVNDTGIDGMKTTDIRLTKILLNSGSYFGELVVNLQSTKPVAGPRDLVINVPVTIRTSPAGANVNFLSCSRTVDSIQSSCNPLDPAKPWIKNQINCVVTKNSGGWSIGDSVTVRLSHIRSGSAYYRHGGYNDDVPLGVSFSTDTGDYISSGSNDVLENGGLDCTQGGANLMDISENPANMNGC